MDFIDETRDHNAGNEIAQLGLQQRRYDPDGNLQTVAAGTASPGRLYAFDAWNRLVWAQVRLQSTTWAHARYEYNGLHWRTRERRSTVGQGRPGCVGSGWQGFS